MLELRTSLVRPQDFVWLLLFGGLALVSPERSLYEVGILTALGIFQVAEPRIAFFVTPRGKVMSAALKLLFGFLLIGFTGGITSRYYLILLLPVVSAATTLGLIGTMVITLLACASYLVFLTPWFLDPDRWEITSEGIGVLSLNVMFLPVVGFLTNQLAEANRKQVRRYQLTAEQLTEANQNLQLAEAAVRRSERLAAIGQLSAGLAHELRNPLGTVKASAEMLARCIPEENGTIRELTGFISSEVDRANSLVTRFLDFARPLQVKLVVSDLTDALDRAVSQMEHHHPPFAIRVIKNYSPDIRPFAFDAELIERVAYNLLLNAVQASAPGGTVTLKTRTAEGWVEFSVIDRGAGIEGAHRENIFNPFFTTKRDGVGLGLAIVARIVDEHKGKITVESEHGAGSVFRVLLPLSVPVATPS